MRNLVPFSCVVFILSLAVCAAHAQESIGHSDDTVIIPGGREACTGILAHNHNGTFENGYCWHFGGIAPPHYGAFAEAYDLGDVYIECGIFWLTQSGYCSDGITSDIYIWEGGILYEPGAVLWALPDYLFGVPAMWPDVSQHGVAITEVVGFDVTGEFTVGYRADLESMNCAFFVAADEDNNNGHPWTCVAPGIGYPSGCSIRE